MGDFVETPSPNVKMWQGNVACAEAALAVGCRFFAGYPITPSTEIAEVLSRRLPMVGGNFIQMEDEIAAMGATIGASLGGAKAMTATSGPGFSLKQENIGFAVMAEVPCVIVNVQRGGPSTGLPTHAAQGEVMQSRWGTHGDHPIIVLSPCSVRETYDMTVRAFNLAEKYRTPVILLSDELVGHLTEKVEVPPIEQLGIVNRKKPLVSPDKYLPYELNESDIPAMANFGDGYRYHVTGLAHDETGFPTNNPEKIQVQLERLNRKIDRYRDDIVEIETHYTEDADILVISFGSTARSARRAVINAREKGIKAGLLRLKTIWPFPDREIEEISAPVRKIIVAEMNLGQIAHEVEWATRRSKPVVRVNKINGEPITPNEIFNAIIAQD
ncbi:2-oxoacid:acceptor oxidoreductase subunit alpha [bacterium]|nr:2-oxoacid:acceptor oxidoreductase subunit alpha [bacterium]MBU1634951.1 2-oxoacid:acceptor oxidoreductase subunit alpha [bacterium]